ncbi:MAG: bifunctional lysylphosphatidylglycerol flippase/synthetase MprF [Pseudomonadota bacterium]
MTVVAAPAWRSHRWWPWLRALLPVALVGVALAWPIAAFASTIGFALSNTLGFSILTGGAVRFRVYAKAGMDAADIGRVALLSWAGLWGGVIVLFAVALVLDPAGLPWLDAIAPAIDRGLGLALLAAALGLLFWLGRGGRELAVRGYTLPLPSAPIALGQLAAGFVDVSAAAFALYVLLPPDVVPGPAAFIVAFLGAMVLASASHTPGGIGVFEATLLLALQVPATPDVIAALVLYRVVYYLLPFALAATALAFAEVRNAPTDTGPVRALAPVGKALAPPLAAGLACVCGLVLMASGVTPSFDARLAFLEDWLPLGVIETSHLLGSVIGVVLLVLAHGLYRRLAEAWRLALLLMLAGAVASLLKGFDWVEALVLFMGASLLAFARPAFYRRRRSLGALLNARWLLVVATTVGAAIWLGFFAFRHVAYADDLWWTLAWDGDASRFLRASVAMVAVVIAAGVFLVLRAPVRPPAASGARDVPDAVRRLVTASPNPEATAALYGDKQFLIDPEDRAFLMYGMAGGSLITKGDPVGDEAAGEALAWQFRELADREALRPVFYAVRPTMLPTFLDMGLAILKIGEVARVPLETFSLKTPASRDFRYAKRRIEREGLVFDVLPAAEVGAVMDQLRVVSDDWLQHKAGKEKRFALGWFEPDYLVQCDCAVVRREGEIVAFANVLRGADKEELSVDLMRYRHGVSSVLMDALFAELLLLGQREGYRWFDLGATPLTGLADHRLATTWNRIGTTIYRHGEEFYRFEGLRSFKEKFEPVWTPQYIACPGGFAVPQVLLDITRLISGGAVGLLSR